MHIHTKRTASVKSLQLHRFVSTHRRRHLPSLHIQYHIQAHHEVLFLLSVFMSKN